MPANASTARRAAASIAALTAALAVAGGMSGPHKSFVLGLPLLVFAAGSLAGSAEARIGPEMARGILACGLAVPAVNAWYAALLTRFDASVYYQPGRGLLESMAGAAYVLRSSGPLLLGSAVGLGLLLGRRGLPATLLLLCGAVGARMGRFLLKTAAQALNDGDAVLAARLCLLAAVSGLVCTAPPLLWAARRAATRPARLLLVMLAVLVAVAGSPPVVQLIRMLPPAAARAEVPSGAPGLSWSTPPLDLRVTDLPSALRARRFFPIRGPSWACAPAVDVPWRDRLRVTLAAELAAETPAEALLDALPVLASHGIDRVVLVGRSTPTAPLLDDWMGWPGAPLLLDRPPEGRWLSIGAEGWTWLEPAQGDPLCVALVVPGATIGDLYAAVRALVRPKEACAFGMALAPGGSPDQLPALGCD